LARTESGTPSTHQGAAIVDGLARWDGGASPISKYDSLSEPLRELDESTFVVVRSRDRSAIDRISEIAAIDGIDVVFVGPYDLALSMGVAPAASRCPRSRRTARAGTAAQPDARDLHR
jgi:2-keto-3-deoxy-L-rhamnonate aldolase RhmA